MTSLISGTVKNCVPYILEEIEKEINKMINKIACADIDSVVKFLCDRPYKSLSYEVKVSEDYLSSISDYTEVEYAKFDLNIEEVIINIYNSSIKLVLSNSIKVYELLNLIAYILMDVDNKCVKKVCLKRSNSDKTEARIIEYAIQAIDGHLYKSICQVC